MRQLSETSKQAHGIRRHHETRAYLAELWRLLIDLDVDVGPVQERCGGQPADATADDGDTELKVRSEKGVGVAMGVSF